MVGLIKTRFLKGFEINGSAYKGVIPYSLIIQIGVKIYIIGNFIAEHIEYRFSERKSRFQTLRKHF